MEEISKFSIQAPFLYPCLSLFKDFLKKWQILCPSPADVPPGDIIASTSTITSQPAWNRGFLTIRGYIDGVLFDGHKLLYKKRGGYYGNKV